MKPLKTIKYKGETYKHISSFKDSRGTIKQRILYARRARRPLEAIKLVGGYYIKVGADIVKM